MTMIKKYGTIILGLLLVAISYNLFFAPFKLDTGGVSGLAIVVNHIFSIPESTFIFITNILLLFLSFIVLGKDLTKNTILGSILLPIFIELTKNINNFIIIKDLEMLIISALGGILNGIGFGLIFKNHFTSGGTDILNQIAEKKFKIPMSKSILYVDGCIVLLGGLVFGLESMIYSIIALMLISVLSNKTMLGINNNKIFYIQTNNYKEIKEYLTKDLKYDITIFRVQGGYAQKNGKLILCSVKQEDYYKIKTGIELIDPDAFIIITENYELMNENKMVPLD